MAIMDLGVGTTKAENNYDIVLQNIYLYTNFKNYLKQDNYPI